MLLTIGIVLLAVWVLGFVIFHVAGFVIHLALIAAGILIVWHFVRQRARS
jgi:hypothetical protein